MAKLTGDDVAKLAQLAQIELSDQEINKFQKEISQILEYFEQLKSVDIEGLEPTNQVTGLVDVMRPDKVINYPLDLKTLFKNVPSLQDNQIKVKKVL